MHSEMWWPRLLRSHGEVAWDDYEKDYSDLPEEVLARHRCGGWCGPWCGAVWRRRCGRRRRRLCRVAVPRCACPAPRELGAGFKPGAHPPTPRAPLYRVAEAIKEDERRAETGERERREALQVRGGAAAVQGFAGEGIVGRQERFVWQCQSGSLNRIEELWGTANGVKSVRCCRRRPQERDDVRKRARQERLGELRTGVWHSWVELDRGLQASDAA